MNRRLKRAMLMASAASSVLLLANSAMAQQDDAKKKDQQEDEIIVTGIRGSLQSSINTKKNSSAIVEAVSAEDIGKLPDVSIADSLARLPGLTAQRLFGRAQVISVRGLSPDFTTGLLNGREQVSSGDNRGVEFDQYPAELLRQVVVYKTPDAKLIGQGLAGTVDLRTIRPLEYGNPLISGSAQYNWNDYGALNAGTSANGYRFNATWVGQSPDEKWGWVLSGSWNDTPTQAKRFDSWGYPTTGSGDLVIGGAKPYVQSSDLDRKAVLGTLEFEPNGMVHSLIDVMYSKFEENQHLRGIEFPLYWSNASLNPSYSASSGVVESGSFSNVRGVVRNDFRGRDSDLFSAGWTTDFQGENWKYTFDLSHSQVKRKDQDLETYSGTGLGNTGGAPDTLGFSVTPDGSYVFSSQLDYSDPNLIMLTDPQGWGQAGFLKKPQIDDKLTALRMSAGRDFNHAIDHMEVGVNLSKRTKSHNSAEGKIQLNPVTGMPQNSPVPIPTSFLLAPTSLDFLGLGNMVSYNPLDLLNNGGVYQYVPYDHTDIVAKAWDVEEKVMTAYTQFDMDTQFMGVPTYGNFGVQAVYTNQYSSGLSSVGQGASLVTVDRSDGDKYWVILPSLNLNFDIGHDQFIRFGAARTMARARMDQMRASFQFGWNRTNLTSTDINASYWNGGGGNPKLRPWLAQSLDLSYEKYFADRAGYFSLAGFYKNLENYVYNQNLPFDFTGYPTELPGDMPAIYQGIVSTPANGSGGYVRGVEMGFSLPFDMMSPGLEGFGLTGNASYTDSDIQTAGPGSNRPLEGLSEFVANGSFYFERYGFQARISARHRSKFLGEVTGFGANRDFRNVKGNTTFDGQVGYSWDQGALNGASIIFQAYNITDESFSTYLNDDLRQTKDYQTYGRTFMVTMSFKR